jgi:hypothetical protein
MPPRRPDARHHPSNDTAGIPEQHPCPGLRMFPHPDAAADAAAVTAQTIRLLTAWTDRFAPLLPARHIPLLCLYAAGSAPGLPAPGTLLLAQTMAWIVAVDEWADNTRHSIRGGIDHLSTVATGGEVVTGCLLASALADIRRTFHASHHGPRLLPHWQRASTGLLTGMQFEHDTAHQAPDQPVPSLDLYLHHGAATSGTPMMMLTAWSALTMPELPAVAAMLQQPLREAALALRLANDLSGHDREHREGSLNALLLGASPQHVQHLAAQATRRARGSLQNFTATSCPAARMLDHHLLFFLRLYQRGDLLART